MTAQEIISGLLIRIPVQIPDCRVWRRNVGAAMTDRGFVRFGIPGEADITGIASGGRRIEIEVKAGRDKLSDKQAKFLAMIELRGGIAFVARDVDGAIAELRRRIEERG
jgi:hypothetical protein